VECVRLGVDCRLWVASLAIHGAPLLNLAPQWSWVRAIENAWRRATITTSCAVFGLVSNFRTQSPAELWAFCADTEVELKGAV
jgi:hypothetical protein